MQAKQATVTPAEYAAIKLRITGLSAMTLPDLRAHVRLSHKVCDLRGVSKAELLSMAAHAEFGTRRMAAYLARRIQGAQ